MSPSILHIDDNKDFLEIIKILIYNIDQNVEVTSLVSPSEALKKIEINDYSIIICDYQMSEMNASEFIMKARNISVSIPIVLLTAMTKEQLPTIIFHSTNVYYMYKTIHANNYLLEILNLIKTFSNIQL